jgi:hypothetical protein
MSPRYDNRILVEIDEDAVKSALNDLGYYVFTEEELKEELDSRS